MPADMLGGQKPVERYLHSKVVFRVLKISYIALLLVRYTSDVPPETVSVFSPWRMGNIRDFVVQWTAMLGVTLVDAARQ